MGANVQDKFFSICQRLRSSFLSLQKISERKYTINLCFEQPFYSTTKIMYFVKMTTVRSEGKITKNWMRE